MDSVDAAASVRMRGCAARLDLRSSERARGREREGKRKDPRYRGCASVTGLSR